MGLSFNGRTSALQADDFGSNPNNSTVVYEVLAKENEK